MVFMEASRSLAWWISPDEADEVSITFAPSALDNPHAFVSSLRSIAESPRLAQMQQRLAQVSSFEKDLNC